MPDALSVTCERRYQARPERVFRALTEPASMRRWWSPDPDVAMDVLAWDPSVGGRWRFAYRFPDGGVIHVRGVFRRVEPDRSLEFTWTWEPPDVHAGIETVVTIDLAPLETGTHLRVHHVGFPDEPSRDRHDAGWSATLDRLNETLT